MPRPFRSEPPSLPERALVRPRLLERLAQRWDHRVVTVVAGAGFGKTALLVAGMAPPGRAGGRDVWLSCEPADDSAEHLTAGLTQAFDLPSGADLDAVLCVTLVLDSGALIALERNDRAMWVRLKAAGAAGEVPLTHGGVLGQVWRGGPRQARLSSALEGIEVRALDRELGRRAGELLGRTSSSDVIDAAVVLLASDGDVIITTDRDAFEVLSAAAKRHVELIQP